MVAEEVKVIFKAEGAERFARENLNAERALRAQQRAINEQVRSIRAEIDALRATEAPNQARIRMLQRQAAELGRSRQALNDQARALRDNANAAKQANTGATVLAGSFGKLNAILAALGVTVSAVGIVKMAEDFNQLQGKVRNSLDDVAEFDSVMKKLIESSNRSGAALDGVVQAFVRLRPAAANLGVTNDELIRFNETFSKMGALAGATSEEIKNTMVQLSQGIAAGALRGDELRSVMEQMPQVARTIAKSMGIPFEQFKKAAEEGKITADQVFKAIMAEAEATDAAFAKLPASIGRSFTTLTNSSTVFVGALNDILDITGFVSKALQDVAKWIDEMTKAIKTGNGPMADFVGLIKDLGDILNTLIATLQSALRSWDEWFRLISGGMGLLDAFTGVLQGVVTIMDAIATTGFVAARGIEALITSARKLVNGDFKGVDQAMNSAANDQRDAWRGFFDRAGKRLNPYRSNGLTKALPGNNPKGGGNIRTLDPEGKKKKKKGPRPETIERQAISDVMDDLGDQQSLLQAKLQRAIAGLGPYARESEVLKRKLIEVGLETDNLARAEAKLNALSPKTKEGQKAKAEALEKLHLQMIQTEAETYELQNAQQKYWDTVADGQREFVQGFRESRTQEEVDQLSRHIEEQADELKDLYDRGLIEAEEYYSRVAEMSEVRYQAEADAIDEQIRHINERIEAIKDEEVEREKLLDLQRQLRDAEGKRKSLDQEQAKARTETQRAYETDARQLADSLKRQTQDAIQQAIVDAFSGEGIVPALKKFGQTLKGILINAVAEALSKRITKAIDGIFESVANGIKSITGSGSPTSSGTGGVTAGIGKLGAKGSIAALAGLGLVAGGQMLANNTKGTAGQLGGMALSAGGGALSGAMIGSAIAPGIGTLAGGLIGGLAGGASAAKPGFWGSTAGQITGYALLGPLFLPFAGAARKKYKAAQRAQYQQTKLQPFLDSVVAGAQGHANDINALNADFLLAARGMQGRGSNGMAMKRAAMTQILELIKQREEAIKQAMVELDSEKSQLEYEIATFGQSDLEKAAATYKFNLSELQRDTQALLDQFKDSEEAKTKILENESLKRQLLEKQAQDAYKQSAQELADLFAQRDEISNQNVFQRRKTAEQTKAEDIAAIDKQIAEALKSVNSLADLGLAAPNVPGVNRLLDAARQSVGNAQIDILINGATDPNAVGEEVRRQMEAFFRKYYGAVA